jgi:hypothetical protein
MLFCWLFVLYLSVERIFLLLWRVIVGYILFFMNNKYEKKKSYSLFIRETALQVIVRAALVERLKVHMSVSTLRLFYFSFFQRDIFFIFERSSYCL